MVGAISAGGSARHESIFASSKAERGKEISSNSRKKMGQVDLSKTNKFTYMYVKKKQIFQPSKKNQLQPNYF